MKLTIDNSKVARCQHVKTDGIQCNTPAMREQRFCYYHSRLERTLRKPYQPPQPIMIDTLAGIRLALTELLNRIARGQVDARDARYLLRGIHEGITVLKLDRTTPAEKEVRIVTDTQALAPHVNPVADREGVGELPDGQKSSEQVFIDLTRAINRDARRNKYPIPWNPNAHDDPDDQPDEPVSHHDTFPISPYTMSAVDYEDDDAIEAENTPTIASDSDATRKPASHAREVREGAWFDEVEDEDKREIENLRAEVKAHIPPREPDQPAVCLLVHQPECDFAHLHGDIFDCPTTDWTADLLLPDLHPFLTDKSRCLKLHNIARDNEFHERPLDAGTYHNDGSFTPAPPATGALPFPDCVSEGLGRDQPAPILLSTPNTPCGPRSNLA